jgi:beta-lactamase regulating signal transducer with metallopeptidase domain
MQPTAIYDALQLTAALVRVGSSLPSAFGAFAQSAGPMVVTALWQGAAVVIGLSICLRLAPRISAAHRFALWTAAFAALVFLPVLPLLSQFAAAPALGFSSGSALATTRPWLEFDARWSLAIEVLWVAASLLRAVDLAVHSIRLRTLWKSAIPVDFGDARTPSMATTHGRAPARLCTTEDLDHPSVIGFFAPRILIPAWLLDRLTPEELRQIVLHESEHLRRGDDWTNLFQKLCLVLFPLNPALWWIERCLCKEREMACDDGVVKATCAPRAYAACLASLAERGLQRRAEALSLGAWQRRPELVHRVHSILLRKHELNPFVTRAVLAAMGCGLVFGSVELARCPQLIAFVPPQSAQTSQAFTSDQPPAMSARLIRTAYVPVRQTGFARSTRAAHETETKAILPAVHRTSSVSMRASAQPGAPTPINRFVTESTSGRVLTAKSGAPQPENSQVREWIVFTAWEQVQTTSPAAQQTAEAADQSSAPAASDSTTESNVEQTNRITVTRLVFRVLPAGSKSDPSAPLSLREGWFVIQL